MDTLRISANQIKRKLEGTSEQTDPKPKAPKKNKKRGRKPTKRQTGSGFGGSIFD